MPVLTLNKNPIKPKHFYCYPEDLALARKHLSVELAFRQDLLFTQSSTSNALP